MNSGLTPGDPTVVAAFRAALAHQGIIALLVLAILSIVWVSLRGQAGPGGPGGDGAAEPSARRVLRIGFGLLWVLDGLLQLQPDMAVGVPSEVMQPTATSSPQWVQDLVNWAGTMWSYHPVQAASAVVWIQVGIGLWLLAAPRGALSRAAGAVSLAWGLTVWAFGESFGGIFAPGLSWLTGAPGAALFYCLAGALLVLPSRYWRAARFGRVAVAGLGLFLIGMAVLQAWPGRGFWQGQDGTLVSMIQSMTVIPQPSFIASLVSGFGDFVQRAGFAVNLVAVIALAGIGAAFLTGRRAMVKPATVALVVLCLADWVLVQDLGFFGGVGTDPNSMIPMVLIGIAAYLACVQGPAGETVADPAPEVASGEAEAPGEEPAGKRRLRGVLRPVRVGEYVKAATFGTMASLTAIGVIVIGIVPMASAQTSPAASTILAQSIAGSAVPVEAAAPGFTLTDQDGRRVSLSSLRGKVVLLTFLDPVCVTECPLIAREFWEAGQLLSARQRSQVELVAVNINPDYSQLAYIRAFDQQEDMKALPDWKFLTGTAAQLRKVYSSYGVASEDLPAGAMLGHSDIAFVIDQSGIMQQNLNFDPGPGTEATLSSFASELADAATHTLGTSS
jgi:cytochrome oxidase Cu insertion factor (SCO1/SenC/PrrC family)